MFSIHNLAGDLSLSKGINNTSQKDIIYKDIMRDINKSY